MSLRERDPCSVAAPAILVRRCGEAERWRSLAGSDASTSEEQKLEQAAAEYAKMADIAKRCVHDTRHHPC
eukprot:COSAG01_NODE_1598_length_9772_cov_8.388671_2_plen_70_part_00